MGDTIIYLVYTLCCLLSQLAGKISFVYIYLVDFHRHLKALYYIVTASVKTRKTALISAS